MQGKDNNCIQEREERTVTTYHIIDTRTENSNTPEHGFGDYPNRISYVTLTVTADTARKAQNKAKKIDQRLRFGGRFGNSIVTDAELAERTWIER